MQLSLLIAFHCTIYQLRRETAAPFAESKWSFRPPEGFLNLISFPVLDGFGEVGFGYLGGALEVGESPGDL